jgi:hypothetical protein
MATMEWPSNRSRKLRQPHSHAVDATVRMIRGVLNSCLFEPGCLLDNQIVARDTLSIIDLKLAYDDCLGHSGCGGPCEAA